MSSTGNLWLASLAAAFIFLASCPAYARGLSEHDFVTQASIANDFEIESSKLALDKSQNSQVKNFAQQMVNDHTKTADKMSYALQSSRSGAAPAKALDARHQKLMDTLESASGDNFNRQYITMQKKAHKEAVSLFEDYSRNGKDKALRDFAAQTLPVLQDHLKHVQTLNNNQ